MHPLRLLLPFLTTAALHAAEVRTFTNTKGEQITATITAATDTHVELQKADKKRYTVPLESLSGADRQYIAGWRKTHRTYRTQILPVPQKGNSRDIKGPLGETVKGNDCWYRIELKNQETTPLTGMHIEYLLYAPADTGVAPQPGRTEIAAIPAGKSVHAATTKLYIPQKHETLRAGNSTIVRKTENSPAGLYLELFIDGKPAGGMKTGTVPADAAEALKTWREKQTPPAAPPAAPQKERSAVER